MKTFTKRFGSLILALVLILSVFSVPANSNVAKAATTSIPSTVTTGVGFVDNSAISITIPADYKIKGLRTNKSGLYVYKTYQKDNDDTRTIKLGLYANKEYTKSSKAYVKFRVQDEDGDYTNYKILVLASNDSPFKKVTYKGKSLLSNSKLADLGNDQFTVSSEYLDSLYTTGTTKSTVGKFVTTRSYVCNYSTGVFKVYMRSGWKLSSIQVGKFSSDTTTNSSGNKYRELEWTTIKNKTKVSLGKYAYLREDSDGTSYRNMQAPTIFRVTYTNKTTGVSYTQDFILNKFVNGNNEDD